MTISIVSAIFTLSVKYPVGRICGGLIRGVRRASRKRWAYLRGGLYAGGLIGGKIRYIIMQWKSHQRRIAPVKCEGGLKERTIESVF